MAVEVSPKGSSPLRALKDELAGMLDGNRLEEAIGLCRRISLIDPHDGMERLRFGRVLERLGRWREAHTVYREAMLLFESVNDYRRARAICSLLIALRPDDAEAYRLLAQFTRAQLTRTPRTEAPIQQDDSSGPVEHLDGWNELEVAEKTTPAR